METLLERNPDPKPGAVPLALAVLCLDCNHISAGLNQCARCGSKSTLPLAPILDRKEKAA